MIKIIAWVLGILILILIASSIFRGCADTSKVIEKEFYPSALLKKYEYFKDLSAAIDRKRADIQIYEEELTSMNIKDKEDKFYYQQRKSELLGLLSIHNGLCEEYNSAMSKFNYRFTNRGDLPPSNTEPLPREIKPYILSLKK